MRRLKATIYTFLFVMSISTVLGHNLRPIRALEPYAKIPVEESELWRFAFTRFKSDGPYLQSGLDPTSIALDSKNFPHISFVRFGLEHYFYNGTKWIAETVDNIFWTRESDIVVDSRDYARITYTDYLGDNPDPHKARVKYAYYTGSSWTTEVLAENSFWSSIALDSQDNPHIAYFNGSGLQYAFFDDSTWTKETVDSDCLNGLSRPFIALDFDNHPRIAYSGGLTETDRPLKYASFNGSLWNIQTIDVEGYRASMSMDPFSNAGISYFNSTALKYAYFDGTLWNVQVVTPTTEAEAATSTAIDSEFRPHIVYQSNASIKYAYHGYNSWHITTINEDEGYDPKGYYYYYWMGHFSPSLSVGSDGKLRLSYAGGKGGHQLRYGVGTRQYLTNFEFTDDFGNALKTQPSLIRANCPELPEVPERPSVLVEFTTFSNQWLDSGNWTLKEVMWQANDVKPTGDVLYTPVPNGTWRIKTTVRGTLIPPQLITPLSIGILGAALVIATVLIIRRTRKGTRLRNLRRRSQKTEASPSL